MKEDIIKRLLKKKQISEKEADTLLKKDYLPHNYTPDTYSNEITYKEVCPCNPKNGGSGVCGCVISNTIINTDDKK